MKKKNLKNKLSLKVKDLSLLSGEQTSGVKGGALTQLCPEPCVTQSCPRKGYSCGPWICISEDL